MIPTFPDRIDLGTDSNGSDESPGLVDRLAGVDRASRPRHWVKNLACFAGLVFSGRTGSTFDAVVEAFESVRDFLPGGVGGLPVQRRLRHRQRDRLDPGQAGSRPIASGLVAPVASGFGDVARGWRSSRSGASTRLGPEVRRSSWPLTLP